MTGGAHFRQAVLFNIGVFDLVEACQMMLVDDLERIHDAVALVFRSQNLHRR